MNDLKTELQNLYADASKHSVYQNVPDFVSSELGYAESIDENWRSDRPRLAYLLEHRKPAPRETWLDFGANTGFFTLSLANQYPQSTFIAVEANPNHARFIERVASYFKLPNVEVITEAIGFRELQSLPHVDFMMHLNVLHHAGHDFDADLVPDRSHFPDYARRYLEVLRNSSEAMLFQMGSNWGGDKAQPLVDAHRDTEKLNKFATWMCEAGWHSKAVAYVQKYSDGHKEYGDIDMKKFRQIDASSHDVRSDVWDWSSLDKFPGEFYRRPLFLVA